MNQEALISDVVARLGQTIGGLLPGGSADAVLDQARSALRQGLDEFDLVPRRELEGHLEALESLRRTVEDLERRIRELEAD
jgi:BMFP domain-containing protein YqiC